MKQDGKPFSRFTGKPEKVTMSRGFGEDKCEDTIKVLRPYSRAKIISSTNGVGKLDIYE